MEEREFNTKNIIDQREAIGIVKRYEEIINPGNKKAISYEAILGEMLKKIRNDLFKMKDRLF